MERHEPGPLIPLYNGMVICFADYQMRISIKAKEHYQIDVQTEKLQEDRKQLLIEAN